MLGFPIRTPPDHSSVANSPGLIAGSNVLHRLLMPRHPPCALHSLSQQRHKHTRIETKPQKTTTNPQGQSPHEPATQTMQPSPTSKERKKSQITQKFELIRIALTTTQSRKCGSDCCRCSRPLCRSQTTTPPTPTHPTTGRADEERTRSTNPNPTPVNGVGRLILQDPTVCLTPSPTNVRQRVTTQTRRPDHPAGAECGDRRRFH